MSEIKPRISVVSDVHLGSLDSEEDLFIQFLNHNFYLVFSMEFSLKSDSEFTFRHKTKSF
jgi:hypothetical protein